MEALIDSYVSRVPCFSDTSFWWQQLLQQASECRCSSIQNRSSYHKTVCFGLDVATARWTRLLPQWARMNYRPSVWGFTADLCVTLQQTGWQWRWSEIAKNGVICFPPRIGGNVGHEIHQSFHVLSVRIILWLFLTVETNDASPTHTAGVD